MLGAGQQSSAPQSPALEHGNRLFHERGCSYCHGADFAGTAKGPSLEKIGVKWDKSRIERQIREGGGAMPAFGETLEPAEVNDLVDLLAQKRGNPVRTPGKGEGR